MRLQKVLLFSALVFSQGALYPAFADRVNDAFETEKTSVPIEESSSQELSLAEKKQKNTELIEAIKGKDIKAVRELLNAGADPDTRDGGKLFTIKTRTALMVAIEEESPKIVDLLLEAGAQVNYVKGFYGLYVIDVAIEKGNPEILAQVLKAGAGKDTGDWQVMFNAIYSLPLNPKVIQMLISNRGIGYGTDDMDIILSAAIMRKNPEVVEMLLEAGINLRSRSEQLLNEAVESGNTKIMGLILDKIILKREIKGKFQNFKFHMRHLLKAKVDGRSALVRAVELGDAGAVKLLLDRGVSSDIMVESKSLRDYAHKKGRTEIVEIFDSKSSALPSACNAAFGRSK